MGHCACYGYGEIRLSVGSECCDENEHGSFQNGCKVHSVTVKNSITTADTTLLLLLTEFDFILDNQTYHISIQKRVIQIKL